MAVSTILQSSNVLSNALPFQGRILSSQVVRIQAKHKILQRIHAQSVEFAGFIPLLILLFSVENPGGKICAELSSILVQKMLLTQCLGNFGDGNVTLQTFSKEVRKLRTTEEVLILEREKKVILVMEVFKVSVGR
jgi:hypothetical protein